jgi:predicted hotdog family 3-hydroxylacyl-ACP dehydratase
LDPGAIPVGELLPHGPEMIVIDRLVSYDAARSVAVADVSERSVFFERTGVPAWAGIEYMAQAIAAHAGFEARLRGEPPGIGFVLGTRAYESIVDEFPNGCRLTISVEPQLVGAAFAAFNCAIETDRIVATAVVNTYRPSAEDLARMQLPSHGP